MGTSLSVPNLALAVLEQHEWYYYMMPAIQFNVKNLEEISHRANMNVEYNHLSALGMIDEIYTDPLHETVF